MLPPDLAGDVDALVADWDSGGKVGRLWQGDARLWTDADEGKWLGWLHMARDQLTHADDLDRLADDARQSGYSNALLLGMGGSSLCPEMLAETFGPRPGFPRLQVLDSTDPVQVGLREERANLPNTLLIVSSKSGSTLEPNIFQQYFFARMEALAGRLEAGRHFVAVTDPGSPIEAQARTLGFRHIAYGVPSIGGRYSALSNFGMVPGALSGVDVRRLLERGQRMAAACATGVPAAENPGLRLGATIAAAHNRGRDKLTLIASPGIADLGAWLEQLLAESTGKQGRGVIPVDREPLGQAEVYGSDRLFVHIRLGSAPDAAQDAAVTALEQAGHPVVRIDCGDAYDIGAEIFRWEFATAVAGSVIGINPFDQPDVEASKVATRALVTEYERTGSLPADPPFLHFDGIALHADDANRRAVTAASPSSLTAALRAHFARLRAGDYVALLAYLPMTTANRDHLQEMRRSVRDQTRAATCVGFGPRFLHSTGQAYKGGPNTGVMLQITCDDEHDLPIPSQPYTFGVVKAAQARGDFAVLSERGRRALRVHLGADVAAGLAALHAAVDDAVA
jgi:transaldolase/glucose-6-phosphate isomerase